MNRPILEVSSASSAESMTPCNDGKVVALVLNADNRSWQRQLVDYLKTGSKSYRVVVYFRDAPVGQSLGFGVWLVDKVSGHFFSRSPRGKRLSGHRILSNTLGIQQSTRAPEIRSVDEEQPTAIDVVIDLSSGIAEAGSPVLENACWYRLSFDGNDVEGTELLARMALARDPASTVTIRRARSRVLRGDVLAGCQPGWVVGDYTGNLRRALMAIRYLVQCAVGDLRGAPNYGPGRASRSGIRSVGELVRVGLREQLGLVRQVLGYWFLGAFGARRWFVAVVPVDSILLGTKPIRAKWVYVSSATGFIADPTIVPGSGGRRLICELYLKRQGRGVLATVDLPDAKGGVRSDRSVKAQAILSQGMRHRSFPTFFSWNGKKYVILECWESNEIIAYKWNGSSLEPAFIVLDHVAAVDPAVFFAYGRWWLMFSQAGLESNCTLYLYYAETPKGPWTVHRFRPVKFSADGSRLAGVPFFCGERLFRPAQDCSSEYGKRIRIFEIIRLSSTEFEEVLHSTIETSRFLGAKLDGMHTFNFCEDLVAIDAYRHQISLVGWYPRIQERRRASRLWSVTGAR